MIFIENIPNKEFFEKLKKKYRKLKINIYNFKKIRKFIENVQKM